MTDKPNVSNSITFLLKTWKYQSVQTVIIGYKTRRFSNMADTKKPTDDELNAMFQGIDVDDIPTPSTTTAKATPTSNEDVEDDPLAELRNLAAPRPSSRATSSATSMRRPTPPSSGRSSEDKAASDEQKILSSPTAPASQSHSQQAAAAGWWGGLSSLASAAVKQARSTVEEIQNNEDAQKWAEQVKGGVGALRGFGMFHCVVVNSSLRLTGNTGGDLSKQALPTFTNILNTLAPPISQHERLQIHITHDLVGYPSLDPMIYRTFSRVMAQVEGGDLLVIQKGSESSQRRSSEAGYAGSGASGWQDGPWWRHNDANRRLGAVEGLIEGTKLVRVSAEAYANDFWSNRGGIEEAAKQATATLSETNPVRSSDIFLAIQAITHTARDDLFAAGQDTTEKSDMVVIDSEKSDELMSFAIYLYDPIHTITFHTISQSLPRTWATWLDASSQSSVHDGTTFVPQLPEEIQELISTGGVDPREWVSEWIEEVLSLSVGIIAQRYVARRMGVGEGGIGRGKRREAMIEVGGGEAARAI